VILFGSPGSLFSAEAARILDGMGLLRAVVVPAGSTRKIRGQPPGTLVSAGLLHVWKRVRVLGRRAGIIRGGLFLSLAEFLSRTSVPEVLFSRRTKVMESRLTSFAGQGDLLLVSCGFPRKIPVDMGTFSMMLNIHPGLLPENRGPCPCFWALEHGNGRTGVTVHLLAGEFDAGDILLSAETSIPPASTEFGLELLSARLLEPIVHQLMEDPFSLAEAAYPQQEGRSYPRPGSGDRRRLGRTRVLTCRDVAGFRAWNRLAGR